MKNAITLFLSSMLFISCHSQKNLHQGNLTGDYQGIIPCADCEGIKTNIRLKDKTFEKTSIYLGKDVNLFTTKGTWKNINSNIIVLTEDTEESFYKIEDNLLIMLDKEQNLLNTQLYSLHKIDYNTDAEGNFTSQIQEGIDLSASGNEPFWSVDIKTGEFLRYHNPELSSPEIIKDFTLTYENNAIIATPKNHHSIKEIRIYEIPCINDMSGMVTEKYVELHINNTVLKGCGKELNHKLKLNGGWTLNAIKDKELNAEDGKKLPDIVFDINANRISGFLGCNRFGGSISLSDTKTNSIAFKQIFSTKMACPDLSLEDTYSSLLQEVDNFKIIGNELQLFKADSLLLCFKKTENPIHEK